jgi:diphthamide biosynthesis enzyme Dph1/Dph2-like protein
MAKILYLETRKKFNLKEIDFSILDKLPGKTISLAATVQYLSLVTIVEDYLKKKNKKIIIKKGPYYEAHVLGCNSSALDSEADTLLLITDGKFHALNNAIQLDKEIYVFNTRTLEKVERAEIDKVKSKRLAAVKRFLSSDEVGILVSTKQGQNFKPVSELKKKIEKSGKKAYVLESDNINIAELENFQLPIYINTACYGLGLDDSRIVNLQDVLQYL